MSRLTDQERKVLNLLAEAYNEFIKLPVQHPSHQREFEQGTHVLQQLVMSRPTARDLGFIYNGDESAIVPKDQPEGSTGTIGGKRD
jgi:hypothetical protein